MGESGEFWGECSAHSPIFDPKKILAKAKL